MALALAEDLFANSAKFDAERLVRRFAERHKEDEERGYSPNTSNVLRAFLKGEDWRSVAAGLFNGEGSQGNGSAMRAAPIGAYFGAENISSVIEYAKLQAETTHTSGDAKAGAVAVAVATAISCERPAVRGIEFIRRVIDLTPDGPTKSGLEKACALPTQTRLSFDQIRFAAEQIGSGKEGLCRDTVPFVIWVSAMCQSVEEGIWAACGGLGDVDTTSAMVAAIVSMSNDLEIEKQIPGDWLAAVESLPEFYSPLPNDAPKEAARQTQEFSGFLQRHSLMAIPSDP